MARVPRSAASLSWALLPPLLAACPGYKVGHQDLVADAATADTHDARTEDLATSPRWEVTESVPCGVEADGGYLGPCMLELEPRRYSTLCDESTKLCVAPEANCQGGWCRIPGRSYLSGAGVDGTNHPSFDAAITVVDHAFEIQETEATLAEFQDIMGYTPEGTSACGPDCPVAGVSIFEAMAFANQLSERSGLEMCYELIGCGSENMTTPQTNETFRTWRCDLSRFAGLSCTGYRLPTTGEWELAARAGSPYCFELGPLDYWLECEVPEPWIQDVSTFCGNSQVDYRPCLIDHPLSEDPGEACYGIMPTRSKQANAFGLYGVHGNVAEWAQRTGPELHTTEHRTGPPFEVLSDDASVSYEIERTDAADQRGGAYSWNGKLACSWSILQYDFNANILKYQLIGFRLARTLDPAE